jgi:uncharacterized protein YdhG (YjbR/CyaY superfamily)
MGANMESEKAAPKDIDEYIAGFPPDIQEILQRIRATIRAAAPNAQEKISYQMPTFYLHGNLVHFAAFRNHIGFYPTPAGIAKFQDQPAAYTGGKGSVQFPLDKPVPLDLIREIVEYRVQGNLKKAESNSKSA